MYNWQLSDWPNFKYDLQSVEDDLLAFAQEIGMVSGTLKAIPENIQLETIINTMVVEAIKTSAIEGEFVSRLDVVSSIRNKLNMNRPKEKVHDKLAQGVGELMVEVRNTFAEPLTEEKLLEWHKLLLIPNKKLKVGAWRTGREPMQVVSGSVGKEKIHFEAPPSKKVRSEMKTFVRWFNDTGPNGKKEIKKAPIRAAIAHLYFESIHPFEDGNGRIGRALAEKALSQTLGRPILLSLSQTIEANKKNYYTSLEKAQRSNEISHWINYFVGVILGAQEQSNQLIEFILKKTRFFDKHGTLLNERQLKVINRMLETGEDGFKGGMTAKKYISLTGASKATATRDLQQLATMGAIQAIGGGRNVSYTIVL